MLVLFCFFFFPLHKFSQYPVADWDPAHAHTAYREAINPRPVAHAAIALLTLPGTVGFGAYSEGVNDDIAKAVWTAAGWYGPALNVDTMLTLYANFFMGATQNLVPAVASLISNLEKNWVGPLATNVGVSVALALAESIEGELAAPADRTNWRLLSLLYRAQYDSYIQRRLLIENAAETSAMAALAAGVGGNSITAINYAWEDLNETVLIEATDPGLARIRGKLDRFAAAIFTLSGAQMSVPYFNAINTERGATLDTRDIVSVWVGV